MIDYINPRLTLVIDVSHMADARRADFADEVRCLLEEYGDGGEAPRHGWTEGSLKQALTMLDRDGGWVQAAVIRQALTGDGWVTRDEVYKLGGYEKGRTLRGFTRPVNRVVNELRAAGVLPADAPALLHPRYKAGEQQAAGFGVPRELVGMLAQ